MLQTRRVGYVIIMCSNRRVGYVSDAPRFVCPESVEASLGERNVALHCEIHSRPALLSSHWLIDSQGTALSSAHWLDESQGTTHSAAHYLSESHADFWTVEQVWRHTARIIFTNQLIISSCIWTHSLWPISRKTYIFIDKKLTWRPHFTWATFHVG